MRERNLCSGIQGVEGSKGPRFGWVVYIERLSISALKWLLAAALASCSVE